MLELDLQKNHDCLEIWRWVEHWRKFIFPSDDPTNTELMYVLAWLVDGSCSAKCRMKLRKSMKGALNFQAPFLSDIKRPKLDRVSNPELEIYT